MENIVYFPFAGKCETYRKGRDDFFDLEETMILWSNFFEARRILMLRPLSITRSPTWYAGGVFRFGSVYRLIRSCASSSPFRDSSCTVCIQ